MNWVRDNKELVIAAGVVCSVVPVLCFGKGKDWWRHLCSNQRRVPRALRNRPKHAIIGGSGVTVESQERYFVDTPFGRCVNLSFLNDDVVFVNRHTCNDDEKGGYGQYAPPHAINFRAMLWAFKELNVEFICAISSTGSLDPVKVPPGSIVMPDDFMMTCPTAISCWPHPLLGKFDTSASDGEAPKIGQIHFSPVDRYDRKITAWRGWVQGVLAPILSDYKGLIKFASGQTSENWPMVLDTPEIPYNPEIVYVQAQGPRFETRSEIRSYKQNGDVLGMTCGNEWTLAQELKIPYVLLSAVDNSCNGLSVHPKGALQEYLDHKGAIGKVTSEMVRLLAAGLSAKIKATA